MPVLTEGFLRVSWTLLHVLKSEQTRHDFLANPALFSSAAAAILPGKITSGYPVKVYRDTRTQLNGYIAIFMQARRGRVLAIKSVPFALVSCLYARRLR